MRKIRDRIAKKSSKEIAVNYVNGILLKVDELENHPERHPPCKNEHLRKLGLRCFTYKKSYIVAYEVKQTVYVVGFIHAKRDPDSFVKILFGDD